MYGIVGKILDINLTTKEGKVREVNINLVKKFVGGSGLATALLMKEISPQTDPLGPENLLIFATGPLTGVCPACARYAVVARSPLTGGLGETTAGGAWGPTLKRAGFDMIIIRGRAEKPVYLLVYDGVWEIKDATHLWGLDTYETTDNIMKDLKEKVSVACIGPAGENLVRFASIINDKGRACGRLGLGAVMGSKKLKAVVTFGEKEIPVAKPEKVIEKIKELARRTVENEKAKIFRKYGTQASLYGLIHIGDTPIKYWAKGVWDKDKIEKFEGDNVLKTYNIKRRACPGCLIGCEGIMEIPEYGIKGRAPEYETLAAFGPLILNDNLKAIAQMNDLCNRLGMDTISTGSVIAFAMECYEKGIMSKDKFDVDIAWGEAEKAIELIKSIAYRKGKIGDLLAEGACRVGKVLGVEEITVCVKGLDIAMHDPRAAFSSALMYATQPRGGSHTDLTYLNEYRRVLFPEIGISEYLHPHDPKGKAELVVKMQNLSALADALVFCKFGFLGGITISDLIDFIYYVTGEKVTPEWILETGERIFNLKRLFIIRMGFNRNDDKLPSKLKGLSEGPIKGKEPPLEEMLESYYQIRGWSRDGYPKHEKLKELSLEEYIGIN